MGRVSNSLTLCFPGVLDRPPRLRQSRGPTSPHNLSNLGHRLPRIRPFEFLGDQTGFLFVLPRNLSSGYCNWDDHFTIEAWDSRSTSWDHLSYTVFPSLTLPDMVHFEDWNLSGGGSTGTWSTPAVSLWSMLIWRFFGLPRDSYSSLTANNRQVYWYNVSYLVLLVFRDLSGISHDFSLVFFVDQLR